MNSLIVEKSDLERKLKKAREENAAAALNAISQQDALDEALTKIKALQIENEGLRNELLAKKREALAENQKLREENKKFNQQISQNKTPLMSNFDNLSMMQLEEAEDKYYEALSTIRKKKVRNIRSGFLIRKTERIKNLCSLYG